jgi:hypothetical protein
LGDSRRLAAIFLTCGEMRRGEVFDEGRDEGEFREPVLRIAVGVSNSVARTDVFFLIDNSSTLLGGAETLLGVDF